MAQVAAVLDEQLSLFDIGVDMTKLREERARLLTFKCSRGTNRGYASDLKIFAAWCKESGRIAVPTDTDTLCMFVADQLTSGFKVSTVERRVAAICYEHKQKGLPNPSTEECRDLLTCARKERRERIEGKKALDVSDLVRLSLRLGNSNIAVRDRAILVFGFAAGMRRSEIARLDLSDVSITPKGIAVNIRWSKTDQEGEGRAFGVFAGKRACTDPVRTMRAWLELRGKDPGPLFTRVNKGGGVTLRRMKGEAVNLILQRSLRRINLDSTEYGAHSLRAGMVTTAADGGASEFQIMRVTGHRSVKMVQKYIRPTRVFAERNPLAGAL